MATAVYDKVRHLIPEFEWRLHQPLIERIEQLKKQRKAVLLAHNYQTPEIYHGVADYTGDQVDIETARWAVGEAERFVAELRHTLLLSADKERKAGLGQRLGLSAFP